ncbi:hypothetical protein MASR2M48_10230 [Spirochaetota bacterium]
MTSSSCGVSEVERVLGRLISSPDINRPGIALSGFFESFAYQRIQLIGKENQPTFTC